MDREASSLSEGAQTSKPVPDGQLDILPYTAEDIAEEEEGQGFPGRQEIQVRAPRW